MKSMILAAVALGAAATASAEDRPRVVTVDCRCSTQNCALGSAAKVTYDRERQFLEVRAEKWDASGYVTRLYSKASDKTYLVMPEIYTGQKFYVTVDADGAITVLDSGLDCQLAR